MYICIEGNIGAGKTTLAKLLAKKKKAEFLPESFEENPLLPLFYADRKKMAFPLEYSFLIERHAQLHAFFTKKKKGDVIADFSLYKCLWFAKANLSKKEFILYKKHFKIIEKVLPKPDLIIFIDTSSDNLLKNIKSRGRKMESEINKKYLEEVTKSYKKGLKKVEVPVFKIKTEKYTSSTGTQLLKSITKFLNQKQKINA